MPIEEPKNAPPGQSLTGQIGTAADALQRRRRLMDSAQLKELVLQSLEHDMGGVKLYEIAVTVAQD
jgi:hypothetical protein